MRNHQLIYILVITCIIILTVCRIRTKKTKEKHEEKSTIVSPDAFITQYFTTNFQATISTKAIFRKICGNRSCIAMIISNTGQDYYFEFLHTETKICIHEISKSDFYNAIDQDLYSAISWRSFFIYYCMRNNIVFTDLTVMRRILCGGTHYVAKLKSATDGKYYYYEFGYGVGSMAISGPWLVRSGY